METLVKVMDTSEKRDGSYSKSDENEDITNDSHENDSFYDDANEDPVDVIREFGTHQLMDRVHKAFTTQLTESNKRLEGIILDKQEQLKRLTEERETDGVQLYSLQQQLARIQLNLEAAHHEFNSIVDERLQHEESLEEISKNNLEKKSVHDDYQKQLAKYSSELSALNETIRQIEGYNNGVKSEIAVTRRAAYKTEQAIQEQEKNKKLQDTYADNLSKQVKSLQQQIAMYSAQLGNQKGETEEANSVILETTRELELIANEKKLLLMQWKASLSGLSRRDEALGQATITLQTAEASVHDYDVEIDGVKRQILKEQERHETLASMRDRLESDLQWVEENLIKMRNERDQLQERFTLLKKSLNQTDYDNKKLDEVTKQLNSEAENLLQSIQVVTKERQSIEEEIQIFMSTKMNINKAVENLIKEQLKVIKNIHAFEIEDNTIENEIERSKVDALNAMATNDQIKEQVEAVGNIIKSKEAIISKYQLEMRQRNDEIEKKMYRVDRLNKKYEKMVENAGGEENLGPLENTIRNLKKELGSINEECKELERDWLKKQSDLVTLVGESEKISDENNELQARLTIVTQQQLRLSKDLRLVKSEVKVSNQTYVDLQKDIQKLNGLINENHNQEGQLQHSNFILEKECLDELKVLEKGCVQLQATIAEVKSTKGQLLDEIMDMERQASLWEKKIQLEKETREALDPTVGQQETKNMEKEIRRMSLRLEALKREQERLVMEMERAIYKRSAISTRYTAKTGNEINTPAINNASSKDITQAGIKKRIAALKKDIRLMSEEIAQKVVSIEDKKISLSQVTSELDHTTTLFGKVEESNQKLQNEINDLLYQKQLNQERAFYKQKFVKCMKEFSNEGLDFSQALQIERKYLASTQALENVIDILDDLKKTYPHLQEVFLKVKNMTDIDISILTIQ